MSVSGVIEEIDICQKEFLILAYKLRNETGNGLMDCKWALTNSNYIYEDAKIKLKTLDSHTGIK